MTGRSLGSIFSGADVLAHLTAQAARLMRLQAAFEQGVPGALAQSCRVANYKSGKVVILAENGSAALKLKQLSRTLQLNLSQVSPEITEIEIRVQVGAAAMKAAIFRPVTTNMGVGARTGLSENTAGELQHLAKILPTDSPLKASLERLLARTKRQGEEI